jgi:glycosyltransferase involved in cell wall biosynthesis
VSEIEASGVTPFFSVALGCFNGARTLKAALDAILCQIDAPPYEVLVVNDASTDETATIATRPGVRLINLATNQGHGATLNAALAQARGTYLALMDDDCVPPPTWLRDMAAHWAEVGPEVTVLGGVVEPLARDTFNRRYVSYRRPLRAQEASLHETAGLLTRFRHALVPPVLDGPRPVYFTVGANMSVRVDAARAVGGFTTERGAGEEESLLVPLRARFGPETAWLFPDLIMRHDFRPELGDSLRRARSYGRTLGRNWVRDRDIPSLAPRPLVAVCAVVAASLVGAAAAVLTLLVAPLVLYRGWTQRLGEHRGEALLYPYVHLVEETVGDSAFLGAAWRTWRRG